MAVRTWIGTTSTAFNTAGNYAENAAPATGDDVYFVNPLGTSAYACGAYDGSAINLNSLNVSDKYDGSIGVNAANPLKIGATTVNIAGGRNIYLHSGATYNYDTFNVASTTPKQQQVVYADGTIVDMKLVKGNVQLGGGTITTVYIEQDPQGNLWVQIDAPTITTLNQIGGDVTIESTATVTTSNVISGTLRNNTGTTTTVNVFGGAFVPNASTTITTLKVWGGKADFNQSVRARTVTNCEVHTGAILILPAAVNNVTFSNNIRVIGKPSVQNIAAATLVYV